MFKDFLKTKFPFSSAKILRIYNINVKIQHLLTPRYILEGCRKRDIYVAKELKNFVKF